MSLQIAEMHEDLFGLSRESSQAGSLSERRNNKAKKKHFMTDQEIEELLREEEDGGGKGRCCTVKLEHLFNGIVNVFAPLLCDLVFPLFGRVFIYVFIDLIKQSEGFQTSNHHLV